MQLANVFYSSSSDHSRLSVHITPGLKTKPKSFATYCVLCQNISSPSPILDCYKKNKFTQFNEEFSFGFSCKTNLFFLIIRLPESSSEFDLQEAIFNFFFQKISFYVNFFKLICVIRECCSGSD